MSALIIKIIACITMLLDHIGAFKPGGWEILRSIGRIAFPLYCYMIVNGYKYTHNKYIYLLRLVIAGIISEIPFDLCFYGTWFYPEYNNVMFTLALGLAAIILGELLTKKVKNRILTLLIQTVCAFLFAFIAKSACTDYGASGVFLIFMLWIFRDSKVFTSIAIVLFSCRYFIDGFIDYTKERDIEFALKWVGLAFKNFDAKVRSLFSTVALLPILFYNQKSGCHTFPAWVKKTVKYAFYAFYPVHLTVLYFVMR